MKRAVMITILFLFTILALCADQPENTKNSIFSLAIQTQQARPASLSFPQIPHSEEINRLSNAFVMSGKTTDSIKKETGVQGFPLNLLNKMKLAVFLGKSHELLDWWNDESLQISINDFIFKPTGSESFVYWGIDLETALENMIKCKGDTLSSYKLDIDEDGEAEIIIIDGISTQNYYPNHIYTLKKSGEAYELLSCENLGYLQHFAIFQNQGSFYLAANYHDSETQTINAMGLFSLKGSSFLEPLQPNYIYVKKAYDGVGSHVLYRTKNASIAADVQMYMEEIKTDLLYVNGGSQTFYGNETEVQYLSYNEKDNSGKRISNLYAVDADNDGQEEYFTRRFDARGDLAEMKVIWYDLKNHLETFPVIDVRSLDQYLLRQSWFRKIQGKMVMFSLYRKKAGDNFLLDVRIQENGRTEILMCAMLWCKDAVVLSDNPYCSDTSWLQIAYSDPDLKDAIPETIYDEMERFGAKVQGAFVPVNHEDKLVPNSLIIEMEDRLFHGALDENYLRASSFEIDKTAYFEKYVQGTEEIERYTDRERFDRYAQHIYQYSLNGSQYFLEVVDSGGSARFVNISLYKEEEGVTVLTDTLVSLDLNAKVIEFNGKLYFIEKSYNFYSKFVDTVIIYPLISDKLKNNVVITLVPGRYEWKTFYQNQNSLYNRVVTDYVSGIREDLMEKSPISDGIVTFMGEESDNISNDQLLRLKSIGAHFPCYEIDFNNDGENEYFSKYYWFPSNYTCLCLITNFYKFSDERLNELNASSKDTEGTLIQQWFHKLDGKVFTFKLYLGTGYNYFLNVSLIEGTKITQVQTYIIAPKSQFSVKSRDGKSD